MHGRERREREVAGCFGAGPLSSDSDRKDRWTGEVIEAKACTVQERKLLASSLRQLTCAVPAVLMIGSLLDKMNTEVSDVRGDSEEAAARLVRTGSTELDALDR